MRTTAFLLGSLALTLACAAGCDSTHPTPPGQNTDDCVDADTPGCVVASSKQRIQNPDVPAADLDALVKGSSDFAFDLYGQLRTEPGNLFYSPYSISLALAMTWAGAKGQTESDMAATLGFTLPQAQIHPAFNALDLALASRGKNAKASDGQGFRLRIANAIWGQTGYPIEQPFLDTLGENYGAGLRVVDFHSAPEASADLINQWVDKNTEGKIKELVTPENITPSTELVLTNAIYFNAAWLEPFEADATKDGAFTKLDGTTATVPMMHGYRDTGYVKGGDFQAVQLPYDGQELSMILIMPNEGAFDAFESSLDAAKIAEISGSLSEHSVDLALPKFKFDGSFSLASALSKLGMGAAFSSDADFSGISTKSQLAIQDVIHKSFVSVNEAGTEAAAATAVILGDTAAPEIASMTLDHPFIFVIRDDATKAILFVGRVADPS